MNRSPYRSAANEREDDRGIVKDLLHNGIIKENKSPFVSPILLVRKKDGSYRIFKDYRELNRHTIKDRYPLPPIEDQLDRLGKGRYFTSLDMASRFHQIPIHDDSIAKTAFVTPNGHYEYLRMSFGLANSSAVFQRSIHRALGSLRQTIALEYLDDILIPSQNTGRGYRFSPYGYFGREITAEGIRPEKSQTVDGSCRVFSKIYPRFF